MTDSIPTNREPTESEVQLWALMHKVFALNESGSRLLELWDKIFLHRTMVDPSFNEKRIFFLAGENNVILQIHDAINYYHEYVTNRAKAVTPKAEQTKDE